MYSYPLEYVHIENSLIKHDYFGTIEATKNGVIPKGALKYGKLNLSEKGFYGVLNYSLT